MHKLLMAFVLAGLVGAAGDDATKVESYPVQFEPGPAASKLAPRFSPYGMPVQLTPKALRGLTGIDHLEGRIKLGPHRDKDMGQRVVLARSAKDKPFDLLFLDDATRPLTAKSQMSRGNLWSNFSAVLKVNHAAPGKAAAWQDYPVNFWAVVEKLDETPRILRFSRNGFLAASVTIRNVGFDVILSDSKNDGVFGPGDWWTVRLAANTEPYTNDANREVGDFVWADGKAWKLELEGTDGRKARLVRFHPDVTQEEDLIRRDKLRADRLAPRAKLPVKFRTDADEVVKDARERKQPLFVKFEADWCIPCKHMDQLVFTAQSVAEVAEGIVCLKVDGDKRKDLKEKYKIGGYPAGVLIGADGNEVARYSGYQGVKDMAAFFRKLKR